MTRRGKKRLLPWGFVSAALLSVLLVWASPLRGSGLTEEEVAYLNNRGAVVFISQTDYPPFEFSREDGTRAGMSIELARWIATTFGLEARFVHASFKDAQTAVLSGEADVITSLFFSDKRAEKFEFTEMIFEVPASIFVAADRPDIQSIGDLQGKIIAMQSGDYAQEYLESKSIAFKPAWTSNFAAATDLVIAGKADAIIGDEQIVLYHIYDNHLTDRIKKVGAPLYVGRNCMAVKAGNPILRDILDKGVSLARSTGALDRINRKWLGIHFRTSESFFGRYWSYILAVGAAALLLALFAWIWNIQLRRQVGKHTAALRESEARLRLLTDNLPNVAIYQAIIEPDGRRKFLYIGKNIERLAEVSSDEVLTDPNALYKQITPEYLPGMIAAENESIRNLTNFHQEVQFRLPSGRVRWFEINSSPRKLTDGRIVWDGVQVDVTDRKRAEELVKQSEQRFRASFESAPVGMGLLDLEGRYLSVNSQMCKILGYEADEMTGRSFKDFTHPDDLDIALERWRKLLGGQVDHVQAEKRCVHKDGRVIWVIVSNTLIRDGNGEPLYFVSHLVDIGGRKRAEVALQREESRLQAILQAGPDPIVTYDSEGRTQYMNPAFTRVFGWTLEESRGKRIPFVPEDLSGETIRQIKELYETGRHITSETQRLTKDGRLLDVLLSAAPVRDERGRGVGMVVSLQDITQKKRLEEQLRQAQKMEAIGTLAGGIAHDFNNILGAVVGYTELAMNLAQENKNNYRDLKKVLAAAERAGSLVRQILTFSRKASVDLRPVDLNLEVTAAVGILERTIPKMISLESRLDPNLKRINSDGAQLQQVLLNLAANAADAMPDGGRLTIETANVQLGEEFRLEKPEVKPGEYVLLRVSDTGQGMDDETREKVFDPFFTTKEVGRGTGLGLATVYGIVKQHEGYVYCQSEPGRGTTFKIYLPTILGGSEQTVLGEEPGPEVRGGPETVLLVDDEPGIRELGLYFLESVGYQVLTAASGEEALEIYRQKGRELDVVVMDLGMPGMGGLKCLEKLVTLDPEVKVIISSGYAVQEKVSPTLEVGAKEYLSKPFRRSVFLSAVRRVLDGEEGRE